MFASENKTLNAVRGLFSIISFYKAVKPLFLIFSGFVVFGFFLHTIFPLGWFLIASPLQPREVFAVNAFLLMFI